MVQVHQKHPEWQSVGDDYGPGIPETPRVAVGGGTILLATGLFVFATTTKNRPTNPLIMLNLTIHFKKGDPE